MVVYYVHMTHDSFDDSAVSVTKSGRSRCNKDNARFIVHYSQSYDVNDWSVTLKRAKVDSRDINFRYILMDGMREPMKVADIVRDNVLRLHNIFVV